MKFILKTVAKRYTEEEAARLKRYGFEFHEEPGERKPYVKLSEHVEVHVGDMAALMGLIEQLGTVAVQGPSSSTTNYSLYAPGRHDAPLETKPQITVLDDYD